MNQQHIGEQQQFINICFNDPNNPPSAPCPLDLPPSLYNITYVQANIGGPYGQNIFSTPTINGHFNLNSNMNELFYRNETGYAYYTPNIKNDTSEDIARIINYGSESFIPAKIDEEKVEIAENIFSSKYSEEKGIAMFMKEYPFIIIPGFPSNNSNMNNNGFVGISQATTEYTSVNTDGEMQNKNQRCSQKGIYNVAANKIMNIPKNINMPNACSKRVSKPRPTRQLPDPDFDKRKKHNDNEQARRRHVTSLFTLLARTLDPKMIKRPAKAAILSRAIDFITVSGPLQIEEKQEQCRKLLNHKNYLINYLLALLSTSTSCVMN